MACSMRARTSSGQSRLKSSFRLQLLAILLPTVEFLGGVQSRDWLPPVPQEVQTEFQRAECVSKCRACGHAHYDVVQHVAHAWPFKFEKDLNVGPKSTSAQSTARMNKDTGFNVEATILSEKILPNAKMLGIYWASAVSCKIAWTQDWAICRGAASITCMPTRVRAPWKFKTLHVVYLRQT
jgi:hypothetical protein